MREIITDLANWPKSRNGQPILTTSNTALLYAQLVFHNPIKRGDLATFRDRAYRQLRVERQSNKPNSQRLMALAVKAQLFRQCFMETLRILDEIDLEKGA